MGLFEWINWEHESFPTYQDFGFLPLFAVFFPSLPFLLDRFVFLWIAINTKMYVSLSLLCVTLMAKFLLLVTNDPLEQSLLLTRVSECNVWINAVLLFIRLLWLLTRKSILYLDRSTITCSIHSCSACLFFMSSGGFWFTGYLWNKYRTHASLVKMSDQVCSVRILFNYWGYIFF